ncbi:MAG TPA: hypothetical protein VFE62_10555 [Gemmataceae bacterium]|nr:hypothetical protein [Gemmataceae bacterium]
MAGTPITQFAIDEDKMSALRECMTSYDVGPPNAEWPNNILSTKTVVYEDGLITREGQSPPRAIDPDELQRCKKLAAEAHAIMGNVDVGMGSESCDPFHEFFIAGRIDEVAAKKIDAALIQTKFGGTIFPLATITVEPLVESGTWWSEVKHDGSESGDEYFLPWRAMMKWFRNQPDFLDTAFVRIGDCGELQEIDNADYPPGTEITGCVLPRLALGLTRGGSLIGLFGYSVQT